MRKFSRCPALVTEDNSPWDESSCQIEFVLGRCNRTRRLRCSRASWWIPFSRCISYRRRLGRGRRDRCLRRLAVSLRSPSQTPGSGAEEVSDRVMLQSTFMWVMFPAPEESQLEKPRILICFDNECIIKMYIKVMYPKLLFGLLTLRKLLTFYFSYFEKYSAFAGEVIVFTWRNCPSVTW